MASLSQIEKQLFAVVDELKIHLSFLKIVLRLREIKKKDILRYFSTSLGTSQKVFELLQLDVLIDEFLIFSKLTIQTSQNVSLDIERCKKIGQLKLENKRLSEEFETIINIIYFCDQEHNYG